MTAALPKTNVGSSEAGKETASESTHFPSETRVFLEGFSWETYKRLLEETTSSGAGASEAGAAGAGRVREKLERGVFDVYKLRQLD